ncbi:SCO4225 family membrane protein [Streptomyces gardneri]|uniref:Uncharacterized protein n=1 Tax=Streptomyces gardneri TaxID=66892 RepID=A0A4Y3RJ39_9ACTN|nr:hypothetical protein [Streptomyces gardneri]GEB57702.1 hypothetical protein SGA01_33070 [Streptomyces gardneri]GHH02702.1 hypothetical protein GCM10017674_39710 [Streptomyces gardneri]
MRDSRPRTLVRLTFANPASLVYLGLVVVASLPVVFAPWSADPSFAPLWLIMITMPTSGFLLLPEFANGDSVLSTGYFLSAMAFCALLHAFLLGLAYRAIRKSLAPQVRTTA